MYATKGLIETQFASKGPPPTIDNSMDHMTRFESRYSSIYGKTSFEASSIHNLTGAEGILIILLCLKLYIFKAIGLVLFKLALRHASHIERFHKACFVA